MRSYPRNSPQAAARIVAMTILADGNLCKAELDALKRHRADQRLGLRPAELQAVVQEICEDLLQHSHLAWTSTCAIDPRTLGEIMAEVDDPALRAVVLQLCAAVVAADEHVAAGESTMLDAVAEHWRAGVAFTPAPPERACRPSG
ncbi:MAG TPA: TerB family tellurite resistance protein [Casimicrobiaceae bacterium]|nr:TerB family tellurite resistance protein [Casimicrobiaceae bacterium]